MRKIILSLAFILSLFSLNLGFSFAKLDLAFAQENLSIKEATMSSIPKKVEYELPYPGILPDNPLYSLKMIRDRIIGFLISDPLKKAEFDLLQADKRLSTGIYLFKKGKDKYSLVLSTISKGENYFEEAIVKAKEAKRQNLETNDILRRLWDSSKKHQEILQSFEKMSDKEFKESTISLEKRVADFEKQVDSLRSKK